MPLSGAPRPLAKGAPPAIVSRGISKNQEAPPAIASRGISKKLSRGISRKRGRAQSARSSRGAHGAGGGAVA